MTQSAKSLDQKTFDRLRRLYILALSTIAVSVIISQILIQNHLSDQENDSRVINIAGRQRMLSQKLTKELVLISTEFDSQKKKLIVDQLKQTHSHWKTAHLGLQQGNDSIDLPGNNSEAISELFFELNPIFNQIDQALLEIFDLYRSTSLNDSQLLNNAVEILMTNEADFLIKMDSIVNQYDREAKDKIGQLSQTEQLITVFTLFIILCEFLFIFLPTAKSVRFTLRKLLAAEDKAKKMAVEADLLSEIKEKTIVELSALSEAVDKTLLFARITSSGSIIHIGKKFSNLFEFTNLGVNANFYDIISTDESERNIIEEVINNHIKVGWQGEVKTTTKEGENVWLELAVVPFGQYDEQSELLIIAYNVTKRKVAQFEIDRLTKESFEERMNQQQFISSKIIENQEREQNRIAKDIHDGIGQMLTGLKYNIESINPSDVEKTKAKVEDLKELTLNIIKGVRMATFNLTPPELEDHGLVPAIGKLVHELAKLTEKEIVFYNKTDFDIRLNSLVEINLYRVTQEAINNAIKYADSTHIVVTISHSESMLSIVVDDNGKGFDTTQLKDKTSESGMGMTYMQERIKHINGRLFINSKTNKGTRLTLNIPI